MPPLYSRKGTRRPDYNYSSDALYFVTVKVQNRNCYLGQVRNGKVTKTIYGEIVENQWNWLANQYPYVVLHALIVMPDHIHGIIEIDGENITEGKIKPLPELIGAFKTTSSKKIHQANNIEFIWHRSFHDRIIRNENEYRFMVNYIYDNPQRWQSRKDSRRTKHRRDRS